MDKHIIEKSIEIKASSKKVWRVFTDPMITRKMGGEYVTDWKVGGSFGWKGLDGNMYTKGTIIQIEAEKILKHSLLNLENNDILVSTITYKLQENNGITTLYAKEELNYEVTKDKYQEVSKGWDFALQSLKATAENLS